MTNVNEYGEFPLKDDLQMEIGGENGVAGCAIVDLDSQITDQDDRLIATATGTFAVIAA